MRLGPFCDAFAAAFVRYPNRLPLPAPTPPSALRPAMLGGWVLCMGLLLWLLPLPLMRWSQPSLGLGR